MVPKSIPSPAPIPVLSIATTQKEPGVNMQYPFQGDTGGAIIILLRPIQFSLGVNGVEAE